MTKSNNEIIKKKTDPIIEITKKVTYEPILDPKNAQFTDLPIRYPAVITLYKQQMASMWKVEEIDFTKDYNDFLTCTTNEQHFIKMTLAMFAGSDGIVNFNLGERFIREIQIKEIQKTYNFQTMMEDIHGEA